MLIYLDIFIFILHIYW